MNNSQSNLTNPHHPTSYSVSTSESNLFLDIFSSALVTTSAINKVSYSYKTRNMLLKPKTNSVFHFYVLRCPTNYALTKIESDHILLDLGKTSPVPFVYSGTFWPTDESL